MNVIVKGITLIRNSILYSFLVSIVFLIFQLTSYLFNHFIVKIFVAVFALGALVLVIVLFVNLFKGIRILRHINLITKLNQRLDEAVLYLIGVLIVAVGGTVVVITGFFMLSVSVITIGIVINFCATLLKWAFTIRLIQVNGILGVYAHNQALKECALSVKFLFYFQMALTVISYLVLVFKGFLGMWYLAIMIPYWLFSLYFLYLFIGLFNQTIRVYK